MSKDKPKPQPEKTLEFALDVKGALDELILKDIENKKKIFKGVDFPKGLKHD